MMMILFYKMKFKKIKMLKLLKLVPVFCIILLQYVKANYISVDMSVNNTQINTKASYTFSFTRDLNPLTSDFVTPSTVTVGSIIQIIFPNDYLIVAGSTTIPCSDFQTGLALNCQVSDASKTVTVKNYYSAPSSTANIYPTIKMDNIINPSKSGYTSNFVYYIRDSSNAIIDQSPSANNGIYFPRLSFSPGTFSSCKISAQQATILTRSKLIVSLTPKNPIPSSGKILLQFPLTWSNDIESNRTLITMPSCAAGTNTASTISCTYQPIGFPVNKIYVTVTGLTTSTLSGPFSFSIQSVLTPPYVDSSDSVTVSSQMSDGSKIDLIESVVSDLTPIKFQSLTFESTGNTLVQSSFVGRVTLSIAKPFSYLDTIVFTLPSNFLSTTVSSTGFSTFSQSKDASSSSITLSNFPSTSNRSTSSQIVFTLQNLVNPVSIKPITVVVSFYRQGSLYQQSSIDYAAVAGTAKSFKIMPTSPFVNSKGNAQVQIQSLFSIPNGAKIKISYPSTVTASDTGSTLMTSAALNGIGVTSSKFSVVSNTIVFENLFQSNFANGLILVEFSQFQNPPTVQPSVYLLTVETSDASTIFTGSLTLTSTLKGLIKNEIASSSYKVLDNSVFTATVQLNYVATQIIIIIPPQITIRTGFQTTCLPNTLTSCYLTGSNLTFQGNFQSGVQTLSWGNVQNPNSFQPTQTFSIYTYNRGWGVEKSLGYIYLQMNKVNVFSSIQVIPSSLKNDERINVQFTINFPTNSPTGKLTVIFPSQLDISQSTCSIQCTKISNNLIFTMTTSPSHVVTTISNVRNSPSFKPNSDFSLSYVNQNNYQSLSQTKGSWTNNEASSFTTVVSTADGYRGESALFMFKLSQLTGKQTYTVVRFNDLFTALTVAPANSVLIGPRAVRFDIQNQLTSQFSFSLITPTIFGDYTFSAQTYIEISGTSYLISESTSNVWQHSCFNTLCRQCDSTTSTICINCYSQAISDFYIFDTAQKTCRRDCLSGYFMTSGNVCSPCSANCLECSGVSTDCTACSADKGLFLDKIYKKCVATCSDGYYKNTQIQQCLQCSTPCLYCTQSATKCTYCPAGKFFLNNDCLEKCPSVQKYIQNSVTRNCDLCNTNCLTCQNSTTTCTSCNVQAKLYLQNKKCVQKCVTNSFTDDASGQCVPCKSPCSICYNSSTVCSTCLPTASTPIWYNYDCIKQDQCPIGNYINTQNSSCDPCPTECLTCTFHKVCLTCANGFTLYQGNCIEKCPNTTYQENKVCLPCTGCATCNKNYTECTSCISSEFLLTGKCYQNCPDGFYKNFTAKTCDKCKNDCPTCLNQTFCLTCVTDLSLYVGVCYSTCPVGTFETVNNLMKICQECPQTCSSCTSLTSCLSCRTGFNLQNDSLCVATCSKGIAYNQLCYPCGLNCANCNTTSTQCQLCDSNFYLYEGKCLSSCPSTTLSLNGLSCVACTVKFGENCTTCSFTECLSCSDGELKGGQCHPCSQGTYPRASKCAPCPSECRSCYNETNCIACADGYFMEQNYCVNVCPLNKIPNGTACTVCMDYCSICNINNSLCSVCTSGFYLYEGRCVDQCPLSLVINLNSTKCVTKEQFYEEYSKQAKIVYFPFSIAGGILFFICVIIKCYSKMTHLATLSCAIISIAQIGSWAAFTFVQYLALINYHFDSLKSFALVISAIAVIIIIAIVHSVFYCKYLKQDPLFVKWQKSHTCTDKFFLVISILLNFKIYRIVHSRLLERDQFSMKLITLNKLMPFSLLSIVSLFVCSLPVGVGSSLALYFSISRDQEFFAALDCLTITSIMIILTLLDLKHESTYFVVEFEAQNLKRQIYEEDSLKFSVMGDKQDYNEKNNSKAELLDEVGAHMIDEGSGSKLKGQSQSLLAREQSNIKGQSQLLSTGLNQTKQAKGQTRSTNLKKEQTEKPQQSVKKAVQDQIQQIDLNNQQIQFQQISQSGDQAIYQPQNHPSQKHLISDQQQDQSSQEQPPKQQGPKWVEKKYDRNGYLLKTNDQGQVEKYDENGFRVVIDDNGEHRKYNRDGQEMEMFNGKFCVKDKDGCYIVDGKKVDKRGYEVRENQQGEREFFDQDGFKVVQDSQGNIKRYDQHGFQIAKDSQGQIHRYTAQGNEAFISSTGKITYKDKQGNWIRQTPQGQWQMYDPEDGFKIVKSQQGVITKYDKLGYRIQKDKWGNIYRYDAEGYRIVFGPGDKLMRFNKDGYEVVKGENGQIRLFNKEGYEVKIDENGNKRFYEEHGYEVVKDYDGDVTLYDSNGYRVVIDEETGKVTKYTSEGLRVEENQDGTVTLFDKRGRKVVELPEGFYEKYDQIGNKIQLDLFGFEVEYGENGEVIRYDKVGNVVDQDLFEEKLQEEEKAEKEGKEPPTKMRRFKPSENYDLEGEYSKMVQEEDLLFKEEQQLQEEPKLHQFHDHEVYEIQQNFDEQLTDLRNRELKNEKVTHKEDLLLNQLQQVDHHPQKNIKQKPTKQVIVKRRGNFRSGQVIQGDNEQDYIELKSIADASVDERSFSNQGVQPIDANDSQYSEMESLDELSPNLGMRSKRKRGQHSEMSFIEGDNHDTKTQYNHKTVNVQIKNKNIFDQNQEIESLHDEENWALEAQQGMFGQFTKDLSNANTNTHANNQLIFVDDIDQQNDTLSSFVQQKSQMSHYPSPRNRNNRYQFDKNTIEEMQNQLFQKQYDQGIRQRKEWKLSNGPNPLVQYAKNLQSNKKSLNQKMYFQQVNKKRRRR